MRIRGPKTVCDHSSIVGEHGIETTAITGHHIGDGNTDATQESLLTRIEGTCGGHATQFGAVRDPLIIHRYHIVEVKVHGQLLLGVVGGTY